MAFGVATAASAQDRAADALNKPWPSEAIYRGATLTADLTFPDAAQTDIGDSAPRMLLLKPPGDGPFPGIVMVHQCAVNRAVMASARKAVAANYAVLMLDSFAQRGASTVCFGPQASISSVAPATHCRRWRT